MTKIQIENDPRRAKANKRYLMVHVQVIEAHYLHNSPCGNARVALSLYDDNFLLLHDAKTKTDAACGYRLDPSASKGRYYDFEYHITKTGNIIIDYIRKEYDK